MDKSSGLRHQLVLRQVHALSSSLTPASSMSRAARLFAQTDQTASGNARAARIMAAETVKRSNHASSAVTTTISATNSTQPKRTERRRFVALNRRYSATLRPIALQVPRRFHQANAVATAAKVQSVTSQTASHTRDPVTRDHQRPIEKTTQKRDLADGGGDHTSPLCGNQPAERRFGDVAM